MQLSHPTPYPDVNHILERLLAGAQAALGPQFTGMYLYGSLASGDFSPETSDIDFLVLTQAALDEPTIAALRQLHTQLWDSDLKWAHKLEGTYLPQDRLPRYDRQDRTPWPCANEGQFFLAPHGWDWIIQRHILRQHGVILAGPPLQPLIDPVTPADLRLSVRELLNEWWAPLLTDPAVLQRSDYQAYAVLSMCRALYALQMSDIVSKPLAATWARETLDTHWRPLISRALAWRPDQELNKQPQVLEFIRYTLEQAQPQP